MANYNTNLSTWGATGSSPPAGYRYQDDEPPVDDFDNHTVSNQIKDIKHLISVTNSRIESSKGDENSHPTSPEQSELYHNQTVGRLQVYDAGTSSWYSHLRRDGDSMEGEIDMNGSRIHDATGTLTIDGDVDLSGGTTTGIVESVNGQTGSITINDFAPQHANLTDVSPSQHHTRYSDSEARSAVQGTVVDTVNGQSGTVTLDLSDNNTYFDSDARSAIDSDVSDSSRYSGIDGLANQVANNEDDLSGYDLQKNGNDGTGIINFKT